MFFKHFIHKPQQLTADNRLPLLELVSICVELDVVVSQSLGLDQASTFPD